MYLLDTNCFVEAKDRYYGFDFAPGFWQWLDGAFTSARIASIGRVYDELLEKDDDLSAWAKSRKTMFLAEDLLTIQSMQRLSTWVQDEQRLVAAARAKFFQDADYVLVAQAHAHGYTVVTQEVESPESKARLAIPDACNGLGVAHINTFEMLRRERARLVI